MFLHWHANIWFFLAIVNYLEPKAKEMIGWNSSKTRIEYQWQTMCSSVFFFANQLFSVLIRLRLGLLAADVCMQFKISESMYCWLFTTWICFLSKELRLLFPFPTCQQVNNWMPRSFKKHFPNTRIIIDCYEIKCQRSSGLVNSSVTYSQYKSRNTWKILIGCTPSGLVSFVSEAWGGCIPPTGRYYKQQDLQFPSLLK